MAHSTPGTTFPPNDVYSAAMLGAFAELKAEGIEVVVFGDIYLEDLRAYREKLLAHAGLASCYPLWGREPGNLYREFVALGFEAISVCVDTARLSEQHLGRPLDSAFLETLSPDADPCGERGEYHSFAFNGPAFRRPVPFALGDVHRQPPFAFQELHPIGENGAAA
jgi:diphthamide synthase (EF-2-diphthine--ammonia ligase)